jgi:hypothetical protein
VEEDKIEESKIMPKLMSADEYWEDSFKEAQKKLTIALEGKQDNQDEIFKKLADALLYRTPTRSMFEDFNRLLGQDRRFEDKSDKLKVAWFRLLRQDELEDFFSLPEEIAECKSGSEAMNDLFSMWADDNPSRQISARLLQEVLEDKETFGLVARLFYIAIQSNSSLAVKVCLNHLKPLSQRASLIMALCETDDLSSLKNEALDMAMSLIALPKSFKRQRDNAKVNWLRERYPERL